MIDERCWMMVGLQRLCQSFAPPAAHLSPELKLIHRALFDPYDQSLWFYHENLMCTFDPAISSQTLAPGINDSDRLMYTSKELEFIEEMLDGAEDCKWIYQALIQYTLLSSKIEGAMTEEIKGNVGRWLTELKKLDPLRKGRWQDLERSLKI